MWLLQGTFTFALLIAVDALTTYVKGQTARGRRRAVDARYPPDVWNMYDATVQNLSRTNNLSEGWHTRFALVVGKNHPGLYTLLKELKKEQSDTEGMIRDLNLGKRVRRDVSKAMEQNEERITNVVLQYEDRREEAMEYLKDESCSPKSCKIGLVSRKAACGSDGFSYYNRCHLETARCHNKNVTFTHRGNCRAQKSCRDYLKTFPNYSFKPQCRSDGNYSAGQCNSDFGYCWCVTAQGTPIPFSATRLKPDGKHRCGKAKKTTRSSPTKQRKHQRACNRDDKATFNSNLLKIFTTEWSRETSSKAVSTDKVVLDWKFNLMDMNHDDMLDKTEYRDLRRLVKKVVKPKRCAKSFAKACDMNRDQVIGRQEWAQCLTRDGMDDVKGGEDATNLDEDEDDEDEEDYFRAHYPPSSILTDISRPLNGGPNYDDESTEKKDDDATDCLSDRKTALDEDYQLYVPECTADGRYAKVQCYKSAGYCWCVNEDTGKNIPGTAVKDQVPKCDQIASSSRPMKGCPEDKKISFLRDLMEYLHASMIKETNGTSIIGAASSSSWRSSKEEQIASWSFVFFDKNKNKQLDKVEWKGFKDKMVTVKSLKRCGKKLPRYCDINKDRHISMTEWLDCLNTHRYQEQIDSSTLPSSTKSGKNPLSLLMED